MLKHENRKIKLLQLLSQCEDYVPTSYFSKRLDVSEKTIYNDIVEINSIFDQKVRIEKKPRYGISLVGDRNLIEKYLREHSEENMVHKHYSSLQRQLEILNHLIIANKKVSYEELAYECYVSPTSIRVDIDILKKEFAPLKVQIASDNTGTFIQGKEEDIQRAFSTSVLRIIRQINQRDVITTNEVKKFLTPYITNSYFEFVESVIRKILMLNKRSLSETYLSSLYCLLLILLIRINSNLHIQKEKSFLFNNLKQMSTYMSALDISQEASQMMGIVFEEYDIEYLSGLLFGHGIELVASTDCLKEELKQDVKKCIEKMSKNLKVDLTDDQKLEDSLLFHIVPMIYRLKNSYYVRNPLLESIKKQYLVMFTLTWYVSTFLEHKYNILLNDDEVAFLTIHFQLAFSRKYQPKNILVVCPIGLSVSEMVFSKVRQIIPSSDHVETCSKEQLYLNDLSDVDFIVSVIPLEGINKKIFYVSPLVSQVELKRISDYYLNLNEKINALQNVSDNCPDKLLNYVDPEMVMFDLDCIDKQSCLKQLIAYYYQKDLVTKDFEASIYQRELQGTTAIYTGVAIPHALPDTVKKTAITIATLKKPIMWDETKVMVVILLAVAQKDVAIIKEVLADLYSCIDDNDKVNKLINIKDYENLKKFIMKRGKLDEF